MAGRPGILADFVARLDACEKDIKEMRQSLAEASGDVRKLAQGSQTNSMQSMNHRSQIMALQRIDRLLWIWDGTPYRKEWVAWGIRGMQSALNEDIQRYARIEAFAQDMRVHLGRAKEPGCSFQAWRSLFF